MNYTEHLALLKKQISQAMGVNEEVYKELTSGDSGDISAIMLSTNHELESYHKSVFIQKFSRTTYTGDCKDIEKSSIAVFLRFKEGGNVWRIKKGRGGSWVYFTNLVDLLIWSRGN
jgi:hypothetical protein